MIKWLKRFINEHTYPYSVKIYDFNMAWLFYIDNYSHIKNLSFCMLHDLEIDEPIVKDGNLILTDWRDINVCGIHFTANDFPSLRVEWKNGVVEFYYCYKCALLNKTQTRLKPSGASCYHRWRDLIINYRVGLEKDGF